MQGGKRGAQVKQSLFFRHREENNFRNTLKNLTVLEYLYGQTVILYRRSVIFLFGFSFPPTHFLTVHAPC